MSNNCARRSANFCDGWGKFGRSVTGVQWSNILERWPSLKGNLGQAHVRFPENSPACLAASGAWDKGNVLGGGLGLCVLGLYIAGRDMTRSGGGDEYLSCPREHGSREGRHVTSMSVPSLLCLSLRLSPTPSVIVRGAGLAGVVLTGPSFSYTLSSPRDAPMEGSVQDGRGGDVVAIRRRSLRVVPRAAARERDLQHGRELLLIWRKRRCSRQLLGRRRAGGGRAAVLARAGWRAGSARREQPCIFDSGRRPGGLANFAVGAGLGADRRSCRGRIMVARVASRTVRPSLLTLARRAASLAACALPGR